MKTWPIFALLILCLGISALMYYFKEEKKSTEMDMICASLRPLKNSLSPTSHLYSLVSFARHQRYASTEYCLTPRLISLDYGLQHDSTLLVIPRDSTDSITYYQTKARVIWENTDSLYHYLLINRQ